MFDKESALRKLKAKIDRTKRQMAEKYNDNEKAMVQLSGSLQTLEALYKTIEGGHWDSQSSAN